MKSVIIILSLLFIVPNSVIAEVDTLVIKFKSGVIEKIAVTDIQVIKFENTTSVNDMENEQSGLITKGNYPNPFSDATQIEFEIEQPGNVEIFIYDYIGNLIRKLVCDNCNSGKNTVEWDTQDNNNNLVKSGTYFYEIRFGGQVFSKKMLLVK